MSVRDRYILGRLGPRRVDGVGSAAPTDEEIQEADESPDENKNGNEDHAEHDEAKTPGTDIAEKEPEEDVADALDVTRSSSLVPSSMGLTFCIDATLPDIEVEVSWGSYYRTKSEFVVHPETGKPVNCWKRVPFGGKKVIQRIGGSLVSNPKPQREWFISPRRGMSLPLDLHCAQESRGTLELLHRQEAQGIAHDHGKPAAGIQPAQVALQTPDRHRERRHAKIRLGLATTCREPQQVCVGFQRTGAVPI